jgi:Ulp1 family protease
MEEHICDIRNNADNESDRLALFKENFVALKNGEWLGNSIIEFFTWKLIDVLNTLGEKDVYKRFKFMDSGFMYCMYLANHEYDYSACRRWVMKKEVNDQGHIFSFLLHEEIFVPVNMDNVHWIMFSIIPANREILVIESMFDPTSHCHVTIYRTLLHFIDDYQ